jgi:hypothetical protein
MDLADGGHVLVSDAVFGVLSQREKYMGLFRPFDAVVKHDIPLRVHQFLGESRGLSRSLPGRFSSATEPDVPLTRFEAYYIAHAVRHREFFHRQDPRGMTRSAATVLLYFLAQDSAAAECLRPGQVFNPSAHGGPATPVEDQFAYYKNSDFDLCSQLANRIEKELAPRALLFEGPTRIFVNKTGLAKLKADCPKIWESISPKTLHK